MTADLGALNGSTKPNAEKVADEKPLKKEQQQHVEEEEEDHEEEEGEEEWVMASALRVSWAIRPHRLYALVFPDSKVTVQTWR